MKSWNHLKQVSFQKIGLKINNLNSSYYQARYEWKVLKKFKSVKRKKIVRRNKDKPNQLGVFKSSNDKMENFKVCLLLKELKVYQNFPI